MEKSTMLKRKITHHKILRKWFYSKIIDAYFLECGSILDAGCGFGDFLIVAKGKNKVVIAADINGSLLIALQCIGFDVIQCDVLHLPFKDNSTDGIFFSHIIEHIPWSNAITVLRELRRVLKNKLIVVTPTLHRDFWTPGHVTSYSKDKLVNVLQKAGFYVHKCFYDKCFMLGMPDHELLVTIFNSLPLIWLRMNIVAVASKNKEVKSAEN